MYEAKIKVKAVMVSFVNDTIWNHLERESQAGITYLRLVFSMPVWGLS